MKSETRLPLASPEVSDPRLPSQFDGTPASPPGPQATVHATPCKRHSTMSPAGLLPSYRPPFLALHTFLQLARAMGPHHPYSTLLYRLVTAKFCKAMVMFLRIRPTRILLIQGLLAQQLARTSVMPAITRSPSYMTSQPCEPPFLAKTPAYLQPHRLTPAPHTALASYLHSLISHMKPCNTLWRSRPRRPPVAVPGPTFGLPIVGWFTLALPIMTPSLLAHRPSPLATYRRKASLPYRGTMSSQVAAVRVPPLSKPLLANL